MRSLKSSEVKDILNHVNKKYGDVIVYTDVTSIHEVYRKMVTEGALPQWSGLVIDAVEIGKRIDPSTQIWKNKANYIMFALSDLVKSGLISTTVIYPEMYAISEDVQDEKLQKRVEQFYNPIKKISQPVLNVAKASTTAVGQAFGSKSDMVKKIGIGVGILGLASLGAYGYTLYTANRLKPKL